VNSADYLFSGSTTRNLGAGCTAAVSGALGDFPASGTPVSGISLSGADSIIGRTVFISASNAYTSTAPSSPYDYTGARAGSCVVGITSEVAFNPTGSGVHYLSSIYTTVGPFIPGLSGVLNSSSTLSLSLAFFVVALIGFFAQF